MIYLIVDSSNDIRSMLVKANDREEVESKLKLSDTQKIVASFTDNDIVVLNTNYFTVISA